MLAYHDEEWGVPSHDDAHLFEMLTLEGEPGLSWSTILRKREGYRRALPASIRLSSLAAGRCRPPAGRPRIVGTVSRSSRRRWPTPSASVEVQNELGSFDTYLWASTVVPSSATSVR